MVMKIRRVQTAGYAKAVIQQSLVGDLRTQGCHIVYIWKYMKKEGRRVLVIAMQVTVGWGKGSHFSGSNTNGSSNGAYFYLGETSVQWHCPVVLVHLAAQRTCSSGRLLSEILRNAPNWVHSFETEHHCSLVFDMIDGTFGV